MSRFWGSNNLKKKCENFLDMFDHPKILTAIHAIQNILGQISHQSQKRAGNYIFKKDFLLISKSVWKLTEMSQNHGVWKSQKKSHSTMRAKRATFTFWVDKSLLKMPKMVHFGEFLKTWSFRSNVLPDMSVLIGQKLVKNAKIQKFKCVILSNLQTMWKWWEMSLFPIKKLAPKLI